MNPTEEIALGPEEIAQRILVLRGQRVLIDADLARIYGVPTGRLNEQVKRNARRFPKDFVFQLTREETHVIARLRSQNAILKKGRHIKHLPNFHSHPTLMNNPLVEIAFILDRSGSMSALQEQAVAGFNGFLADQIKQPGEARLTLVLFDDDYLVPVAAAPLPQVPPLDAATYVPRNTTALLDAIGRTIDELGQRLAATPEPDRPGQVIVAILTDGLENASTRYTWQDIAARIRHQREKYRWQFLFLGANQDAIATATRMDIDRANAGTYEASTLSYATSTRSLSRRTSALRRAAAGQVAEPDLAKPMQEIVAEEQSAMRHDKP